MKLDPRFDFRLGSFDSLDEVSEYNESDKHSPSNSDLNIGIDIKSVSDRNLKASPMKHSEISILQESEGNPNIMKKSFETEDDDEIAISIDQVGDGATMDS